MRDVFEEDDDYESNSPVLLSVPQLEGPIAFTKEALKNWGWAHIDNSEQSVQFRISCKNGKITRSNCEKFSKKLIRTLDFFKKMEFLIRLRKNISMHFAIK